ncbi:DAK2 domain-containing protein [Latilactobacillus sakei]|uniref:DAK2 domain-containing protein n=1 Tax=Latilactobacillus sakei TaxID=1599 RepID=UPI000339BE5E|nr:DAK2 domain-containing protein [Latilactobacillus sakei]EOR85317.1 dihydroxyacetone kinase family protein [Latilactobacillus sakei subsp. sakei LS25]PKX63426.1 DAK2 domain-containing protein [Latilactobacillus sakei]PKX67503.1 DAK2 domain-containing protein [Latilactobacillus sakei]SPS04149.1 dihydroxyacetone kinase subunit DhaL [Latilactobacillus sakei]
MKVTEITATEFQAMMRVAAHRLTKNAEFVNSLNVFPVPDGDTGTNMSLTFQSGAKAVNENNAQAVGELSKSLAKGLLMGARGNSGVISSQIFRGFSKSMEEKTSLTAQDLADAFTSGVQTAYKAVMKPVEGTILTVAREGAKAGAKVAAQTDDIGAVVEAVVEGSKKALLKTPELLPVLKEVGVVDSGGQGLVFIYEGFLEGLTGQAPAKDLYTPDEAEMDEMVNANHHQTAQMGTEEIENGYCTEIMVALGDGTTVDREFDYDEFRNHLNGIGDSLLVVADDEVVKVHVHTEHPGTVMAYGQHFGSLMKIKVDNMRLQHDTIVENDQQATAPVQAEPVDTGIIAISAGAGVAELFRSLGATYILSGGQTMNPSTQDILDAIQAANAKKVILLPNNKNIFLAAEQAAEVAEIPVEIVQSRTIAQGMTALLSFDPSAELQANQAAMTEALDTVISGQVTQAIRDTTLDGLEIKKDDYMGIIDGKIKVSTADRQTAAIEMVQTMLDEDSEIVTIIVGEDGDMTEAEAISDAIMAQDDELEVEIHEGDQPVYPYLISVE